MPTISSLYINKIIKALAKEFPNAECALNHTNAFELLVATVLSAQCTDERVNKVTPLLFKEANTPLKMSKLSQQKIEKIIHSTGFYKSKAKNILEAAKKIQKEFNGVVPNKMEDLITLPGVGRKTANVLLGTIWNISEGIVVDTHVLRISKLLKLTNNDTAEKVEQDLITIIPKKYWILYSHLIILHGRKYCKARKQDCENCPLKKVCPSSKKQV